MKRLRRNSTPWYQPPGPRQAMVSARTDHPEEVRAAQHWLAEHQAALTFVSEDEGCGCCIHLWRIEGPADVLQTLPPELSATGDWTSKTRGKDNP